MSIDQKKKDVSIRFARASYSFGSKADWEAVQFSYLLGVIKMLTAQLLNEIYKMPEVDGWTGIQRRLDTKFSYSQWFTIIFIFLGHFIFTNLFIGIIIMNIHDSTERYNSSRKLEREAILQLKKDYLYKRQREDVQHMLEKQRNSKYANFAEMTRNFRGTLRHDDYVIMTDVSCGLTWLETYIDSLDHLDKYSHRCQQSHFNMANVISELLERKIRLASSS